MSASADPCASPPPGHFVVLRHYPPRPCRCLTFSATGAAPTRYIMKYHSMSVERPFMITMIFAASVLAFSWRCSSWIALGYIGRRPTILAVSGAERLAHDPFMTAARRPR